MSSHKHIPRKRFGQHFLQDKLVVQQIVESFAPKSTDHIVEIGPGLGVLTQELLTCSGRMDAIELDRDLIAELINLCKPLGELRLFQADALEFDFAELLNGN